MISNILIKILLNFSTSQLLNPSTSQPSSNPQSL
jgi:hypothetical protein